VLDSPKTQGVEKISYQLPRNVLIKIWLRRWLLRPRILISLGFMVVLAGVLLFWGIGAQIAAGIILGMAIMTPINIYRAAAKSIDNDAHYTDQNTLEFGPSGVVVSGPNWKSELPWNWFKGFSEDSNYFYLEILPRCGQASIIPKTAFTSEQQSRFRECAKILNQQIYSRR
jgi:hypothetical protein